MVPLPTVSVIIPTYNSANLLSRAVDSVLEQTYSDLELIIIDDGSTDSTDEVVSEYSDERIKYIKHELNRGGSAARNTGIENAKGKYIAFLDADDEWLPPKLECQLNKLRSCPEEYVAVHCKRDYDVNVFARLRDHLSTIVGTKKRDVPKEGGKELIKEILSMNLSTGASTLIVETKVVNELGGFDSTFPRHQDWEFLIRVLQQGKLAYVDEPLVIKHHTGEPCPEVFAEGKRRLLKDFSEEISEIERDGNDITHTQKLHLAKMYIESGQIVKGISQIKWSKIDFPQFLGVSWSIMTGLCRIVMQNRFWNIQMQ